MTEHLIGGQTPVTGSHEHIEKVVTGLFQSHFSSQDSGAIIVDMLGHVLSCARVGRELDNRLEQIFRVLLSHMIEDPQTITRCLRTMFIAKYFERIGDQSTNICEQVVYMAEARIIKHGPVDAP